MKMKLKFKKNSYGQTDRRMLIPTVKMDTDGQKDRNKIYIIYKCMSITENWKNYTKCVCCKYYRGIETVGEARSCR